jgi:hypothetical protein
MYVRVDGYHEVDGSKSTDVVEIRALSEGNHMRSCSEKSCVIEWRIKH